FRVAEVGNRGILRQFGVAAVAAHRVELGIAPDEDEPGGGVARRPLDRPGLHGAQAGFLKGFFRPVEIAEIAQERAHHLRAGAYQCGLDPGQVRHAVASESSGITPFSKSRTGRISKVQLSPSLRRFAKSITSSRFSQSTR